MADANTRNCPVGEFTKLNLTAVASIRLSSYSSKTVHLVATAADVAPTGDVFDLGPVPLGSLETSAAALTLHQLFPSVIADGGTGFVWVYPAGEVAGKVSFSHA